MKKKELHIAPMLNYSHRDFRALIRILSKRAVLWTEMVVDETIVNAKELETHLGYDPVEHPIICQLGGNCPDLAGQCAQIIARDYNYDEININCGCPSDKVANEREFGATLMKNPELVKEMVSNIQQQEEVDIPISVKTRIGIMGEDDELVNMFIATLEPICKKFILHARQVHLNGLNARQNRSIPPLDYPLVYAICRRFPQCEFNINGGIQNLEEARSLCFGKGNDTNGYDHCNASIPPNLRGCMLGRKAVENPSLFWDVDRYFYREAENPCRTRREVLIKYTQHLEQTYPRRCCDDDERVTYIYPPPLVDVPRNEYCSVCETVYSDTLEKFEDGLNNLTYAEMISRRTSSSEDDYAVGKEQFLRRCPGVKLSTRVIGRALKPLEAMFAGMPCSKSFRLAVQANPSNNNCGPGFVLRSIMLSTPDQYLDEPFVKTEDLKSAASSGKNKKGKIKKSGAVPQEAQ